MAIISGVTVEWWMSPRIITIPDPIVSVSIEDLQDTLLDLEEKEAGIIWQHLRETSGGEDLGGGVSVGFTMELQNAQIAFEARSIPQETGTATSIGTTVLQDSTALFITNGVERGAQIINYTDESLGTVLSVDSETQITHTTLTGGTSNDWTVSDAYSVLNETRCEISGGNLVAVDDVGANLSPTLPTIGVFVVRTSSSSATLQNQEALEASSFIGKEGLGVSINAITGVDTNGTISGRRETPVKTESKALSIAIERGFRNIYVLAAITLTADYSAGYTWFSDSPLTIQVTLDNSCNVSGNKFQDCFVQGKLDNNNVLWECVAGSLTNVNGFLYKCTVQGPLVISDNVSINKCWVAPNVVNQVVTVDFNNVAKAVLISQWEQGKILAMNMVTGSQLRMAGTGGFLTIDASCTGGDVTIDGAVTSTNEGTLDSFADLSMPSSVWKDVNAVPLGTHLALE